MSYIENLSLKAARDLAGQISIRNTKMPGSSFAISAKHCQVGAKLALVAGSVCHKCYALKLQNMRPSVNMGWTLNLERSTDLIERDVNLWVGAMVKQILHFALKTNEPFHRWFDSGDLQSVEMLSAICQVAVMTPGIKHWLPTREAGIVKRYRKAGGFVPANLVIRVSSTMIDDAPISGHSHTSTVHRKGSAYAGHACPAGRTHAAADGTFEVIPADKFAAMKRDEKRAYDFGHCGICRRCWDADQANISYPLH
jgi:hypothetical protein